ncbi:glycoside hydrolase family 95 protein [Clostridium neonatale]|nr:glycoside hydrolase family 95 protein [Clostridium neonatale]
MFRETIIKFDNPAKDWEHATPIGNGKLGAMVFGNIRTERIQLNEDSLWSGGKLDRINYDGPEIYKKILEYMKDGELKLAESELNKFSPTINHMRHYQALGDIWIEHNNFKGELVQSIDDSGIRRYEQGEVRYSNYTRSLDLEYGIGKVEYSIRENNYKNKFFASYDKNVIIYDIKSESRNLDCCIYATRQVMRPTIGSGYIEQIKIEDGILYMTGKSGDINGIEFCLALKVLTDGEIEVYGSKFFVKNATKITLIVTGNTSYRYKRLKEECTKLLGINKCELEKIEASHKNYFSELFNRSTLILNDKEDKRTLPKRLQLFREGIDDKGLFELYYNFSKYLYISSGIDSLPITLQGIWNQEFSPPWGSRYTININLEMNYWHVEKSGLPEVHMSLLNHLKKIHENGLIVAKKYYGLNGAVTHHNTDIWGDSSPIGNNPLCSFWPYGGAWLCTNIMEHYRYNRDIEFLKEYYQILKDYVIFILEYFIKLDNGSYVTGPSASPENRFLKDGEILSYSIGNTMDMQISKTLINDFLEAAELLNDRESEYYKKAIDIIGNLKEIKITKDGRIQEWIEDFEEVEKGHRHISHLYGLFPSNLIKPWTDKELSEACKKTIRTRIENGGGHTGWSKAWIINFWCRLLDKDEVYKNLREIIENSTNDNLLDIHPPFQIDGNFGAANGILEMIFIDNENEIILFPALSEVFDKGSIKDICLKLNGKISIKWEKNNFEIRINSNRDMRLKVYNNNLNMKSISLNLEKGKEVVITQLDFFR